MHIKYVAGMKTTFIYPLFVAWLVSTSTLIALGAETGDRSGYLICVSNEKGGDVTLIDSVTHQVLSNIRYDFIHHPLSDVFVVYNDTRFQNVLTPTAAQLPSRALILKVTHLLSF